MIEDTRSAEAARRELLAAREARAALRRVVVVGGRIAVSLSLNVPGWPKTDPLLSEAFRRVREELTRFLLAHRLPFDPARVHERADGAGDFFLAALLPPALTATEVKPIAERFEARHPLGRLVDVDVTDPSGEPLSSHLAKPCLLCPDRPALVCIREAAHPVEALRQVVHARAAAYLGDLRRESVCRGLAEAATRAMLHELAHAPKPGLVDRLGVGSHDDMDFFTFLASSAAISGRFFELAALGFDSRGNDLALLLPELRLRGLAMEEAMFSATGGVNTHKGLIFLMGLALTAAGRALAESPGLRVPRLREIVQGICQGIVSRELGARSEEGTAPFTHGEEAFRRLGRKLGGGARAEAEAGFPTVREAGLPALEAAAPTTLPPRHSAKMQAALDAALYALMAASADTNLLHRGGAEALAGLQHRAAAVRDAGDPRRLDAAREELFAYVARHRLSPGGSGDLLAITLFLYFAKRSFPDGL